MVFETRFHFLLKLSIHVINFDDFHLKNNSLLKNKSKFFRSGISCFVNSILYHTIYKSIHNLELKRNKTFTADIMV